MIKKTTEHNIGISNEHSNIKILTLEFQLYTVYI